LVVRPACVYARHIPTYASAASCAADAVGSTKLSVGEGVAEEDEELGALAGSPWQAVRVAVVRIARATAVVVR
jgi:hypothetical protein